MSKFPQSVIHWLKIAYFESVLEFCKCLRIPAFSVSLIVFPLALFLFFGLGMKWGPPEVHVALHWAIASSCMGAVGVGLFGFGVYVATERAQGWLLLKKVSPMPISVYFLAKIAMALMFSTLVAVIIFCLAGLFGHIPVSVYDATVIIVAIALTAIPFCALGLAVAFLVGPNSAHAVINVVYLPQVFLGGIAVPVEFLPNYLQTLAQYVPVYHAFQFISKIQWGGSSVEVGGHAIALVLISVLFVGLASILYQRSEGSTYG